MDQSQASHQLGGEVTFLRAECGASREGDAFGAVDRVATGIRRHECGVARRLDVLRDLVQHEIPRHALPAGRPRGAVLRRPDTAWRARQLHRSCPLGTEATFVDSAVRVPLDLQKLDAAIALLTRVGDQRTADCAVRTDGMRFLCPCDAQVLLDFRGVCDSDVEAEAGSREGPGARHSGLYEVPTCNSRQSSLSPPTNGRRRLTLSHARTSVKFQPVEINRSDRSSASGFRRRSMMRSLQGTITPVAPAASQ